MKLKSKKLKEIFGKIQKNNSISANEINGNIVQDSVIKNKYITISDPIIAIRNIGEDSEELSNYFQTIRAQLVSQHKLFPYYETGIEEVKGKNYLYSKPAIPEAKEKYPSRIKGTFKIIREDNDKKYSWKELEERAYIYQKPIELEPIEVVKLLGNEIDPFQEGFLEKLKNITFKLVPEKLPEAIPCILKIEGSDIEYNIMLKVQPVDPDKNIICLASEDIGTNDGLKVILTYYTVTGELTFKYSIYCSTCREIRKFILFQMAGIKGAVIKIETKEDKEEIFKVVLQKTLSSESMESLRNKLQFINDVMLVEAEFDVSFDITKKFDVDDQKMITFLANSIRAIPQEIEWNSYNMKARLTPETDENIKNVFKSNFSIKHIHNVDIQIQGIWIKNIKIKDELKCCKFSNPDQIYKDFIEAQYTDDKCVKIELIPGDEDKKALRIAIVDKKYCH